MRNNILAAVFFILLGLVLIANAETKGNLEFASYRGAGFMVLPQYAAGTQSDLLWVSARDNSGTATHLIFTAVCQGVPSETRMVAVWPHGATTTVFTRNRTTPCTISVDAVVAGERQVFQASE